MEVDGSSIRAVRGFSIYTLCDFEDAPESDLPFTFSSPWQEPYSSSIDV